MTPTEDHPMRDMDGLIKSETSENHEQNEPTEAPVSTPQDSGQKPESDMLSGGLEMLLSNPQLLASISSIAKSMSNKADPAVATAAKPSPPFEGGISSLLSNPDIISKIPDIISVISPMLGNSQNSVSAAKTPSKPKNPTDNRATLMAALKPYLNPSRQEALNYLLKLNQLGDILKTLN